MTCRACHPCANERCPGHACPEEPHGCLHGMCPECAERCPDCESEYEEGVS